MELVLFRPREPKLKEREATSLIPCHDSVASKTGTSKRRETLPPDHHLERSEDVSDKPYYPFLLAFARYSHFACLVNWSLKSKRRTGQGTGRLRTLRHLGRKVKNGFREGCKAPENKKWKKRSQA